MLCAFNFNTLINYSINILFRDIIYPLIKLKGSCHLWFKSKICHLPCVELKYSGFTGSCIYEQRIWT